MYLVYETESDALAALDTIHTRLGIPIHLGNGYCMEQWAIPQERLDGKWVFEKPSIDVEGVQEEYSEDWFSSI